MGGVLVSNVNVLLLKADSDTGVGVEATNVLVRSLNCLQKSAMFSPRGPSACITKTRREMCEGGFTL